MTSRITKLAGGCLCGAVKFEVDAMPEDVVDYCHCTQCRKSSGAPVVAWIQVAPSRFRMIKGTPRSYRSSARATRWFCGSCGSSLQMTDLANRSVGVPLGTLDEPDSVLPTVHGWAGSKISWFDIADGLPRYSEDPPYDL